MLELPEVTIWTMVWTDPVRWLRPAGQVLRYCASIMRPARLVLFSSQEVTPRDFPFDVVRVPKLGWQGYSLFINRVVPAYLDTPFAMSVHEDGFPLEVGLWRPEFLAYDYIGAPWDDGQVGNGGFNIESRKLMDLKRAMPVEADEFALPADRFICTARRGYLEERGVRFAPRDLALAFSTEQVGGERPSFGFHGRQASVVKYRRGWEVINAMRVKAKGELALVRNRVVPAPRVRPAPRGRVWPVTRNGDLLMVRNRVVQVPRELRGRPSGLAPVTVPPVGAMEIVVVYIYPVIGGKYHDYARRFVARYLAYRPKLKHRLLVVSNGGQPRPQMREIFEPVELTWFYHDNSGWDIGAYQHVAREVRCDLLVCLGASTYFRREGWLERMAESLHKHGLALYGGMGHSGDSAHRIWPHLRTTGFWLHPNLLNAYPTLVNRLSQRYEFEHGRTSLSEFTRRKGLKRLVVTYDGEYEPAQWLRIPNGYHRGDQSNCLTGDRLTEPPFYRLG